MNCTEHQAQQVEQQREQWRWEWHFKRSPAAQRFRQAEQKQEQNLEERAEVLGLSQNRHRTTLAVYHEHSKRSSLVVFHTAWLVNIFTTRLCAMEGTCQTGQFYANCNWRTHLHIFVFFKWHTFCCTEILQALCIQTFHGFQWHPCTGRACRIWAEVWRNPFRGLHFQVQRINVPTSENFTLIVLNCELYIIIRHKQCENICYPILFIKSSSVHEAL